MRGFESSLCFCLIILLNFHFTKGEWESFHVESSQNSWPTYGKYGYEGKLPYPELFQIHNNLKMKNSAKDNSNFQWKPSLIPYESYVKRSPSLSISNNIDVLRKKLREQVNLRLRNRSRSSALMQNTNILKDLGKR